MSVRVAIVGASGAAGGEIARYLAHHPQCQIAQACAHSQAGSKLRDIHPHLPVHLNHTLTPVDPQALAQADVVFVALPHGRSGELTAQLQRGSHPPLVIDVGADHRLTDAAAWEKYYGSPYQGAWTYAMPELIHASEVPALVNGEQQQAKTSRQALAKSRTIAVPGCNVTAATLAIQPAIAAGLIHPAYLTITAAVGYSGAGKSVQPRLMAIQALSNLVPYSAAGAHRHIPEIVQNLTVAGGQGVRVSFTPVLVPTSRGILAVVNAPLSPDLQRVLDCEGEDGANAHLQAAYQVCYQHEPLIELTDSLPQSQPVLGTARAQVWAAVDATAEAVTAICALDNLGKGTAAAAVQAMNLALGLPELAGVNQIGVAP